MGLADTKIKPWIDGPPCVIKPMQGGVAFKAKKNPKKCSFYYHFPPNKLILSRHFLGAVSVTG